MAIASFHDLVALLQEHPEWRAELRRLVLSEELLRLPERIEALFRTYEESSRELLAWQQAAEEEWRRHREEMAQLLAVVAELAAEQRRQQEQMRQLVAEQQRTALEVRTLARELKATRKMVGGLSLAVGYALEDRAIRGLPLVLPRVAGIQLEGSLRRDFLQDALGEEIEVNLLGYGTTAEGEPVTIIGEAKAKPRVRDLENLLKTVERLQGTGVLRGRVQPILVGYLLRPEVQRKAENLGIRVFASYELPFA